MVEGVKEESRKSLTPPVDTPATPNGCIHIATE